MTLNYLKIALRYLVKNKTFSAINVFSLTVGFTCFILITLYLHDELNFDMFHRDAKNIYRITQEMDEDGTIRKTAAVASLLGPELKKQYTEISDVVRMSSLGRITMGNDPAHRDYEVTVTTDPNFFTFFDFPLIEGNPATVLQTPNTIVISERIAEKYFGKEPAVGKSLWTSLTSNGTPLYFTVSGIMKNSPHDSHLQLDIIFSDKSFYAIYSGYDKFVNSDWVSNSFVTYLKFVDGASIENLQLKLTSLAKSNYPPDKKFNSQFSFQPLHEIHLYSTDIEGTESNTNATAKPFYLYMFSAVAFLILLIACLNYMNLSTAAAFKRTREIGTRKTLGALKAQLLLQFSGEAIILSMVSLFLSISVLQLLLPAINEFTEKELSLTEMPIAWAGALVLIVLSAGLASSLYPALVIARVRPVQALKKDIHSGNQGLPVRKILIVAQFSISITMIASTLVIYRQLQFIKEKDLGFSVDNLLVIDINSRALRRNFETVKSEFLNVPEVESITTSTRVPGEWKSFPIASVHPLGSDVKSDMVYVGIDQDFLNTFKMKLVEGRNFTSSKSDSTKVILTKLAVKELNLENPVGKVIEIPSTRSGGSVNVLEQPFRVEVIGVVDDFHFESLRQKMMPLIFAAPNTPIQRIDYYTLRINTRHWDETLKKLQAVNTELDPENPMEYTFLNSRFEEFYKADEKRGQIFLSFSAVIVLIACLGLFALVSFSIEGRKKEIGIRKVLGASVEGIVSMISKEFMILIIIASIIAIPIAYAMMASWLQDFSYHISMGVGIFVVAGFMALVIALLTVGIRSFKAATSNPIDALRSE